jgi:endoglucanase
VKSHTTPARVLRLAERTLSCPTAPYREGDVIAWVREFAAQHPKLRIESDAHGNLHLRRRGVRARRSPLVLSAHMDHPGFRALRSRPARGGTSVEALFLGGVRPSFFPGAGVRFFQEGGEVRARVREVRADRRSGGLRVRLSAARPVARGALGMWDLVPFRRAARDPGLLESRAVDDLVGVAAILALLDVVERVDPRRKVDVRALFTRAEEVGFVGAIAAARGGAIPRGSRLVVIEASKALPHAPQGEGPILRVGDRTSIFDDALTRFIGGVGDKLAKSSPRFRWQRKLMDGGTCESTAFQLYGYRSAAMCLPLGNYHNMSERGRIAAESIRLSDLVGLVRFFEGLVRFDAEAPRPGARDPLLGRLESRYERGQRELARDPFA